MDQSNSTVFDNSSSPGLHHSWIPICQASAVIFSLFFSVGVPGNIAVIILKPNWDHLSSLSQSLLLNLAVSDLLGLLTLPFWIDVLFYGWEFSSVFCKLLVYVGNCSFYVSLLTVTGLSLQRYLLVVHQHKLRRVPNRLLMVLLWLVVCIMCIPYLVIHDLVPKKYWTDCEPKYSSVAQYVAVQMIESIPGMISLFIVVFSYVRICRKVNQSTFFNNPQTTRLITSIVVSFVVIWTLGFSLKMLEIAAGNVRNTELKNVFEEAWIIVIALINVNKCLNPLLYAFTSSKFCKVSIKQEPTHLEQRVPDTAATTELS